MSTVAPAAGSGTQTASTYAIVPRAVLDDQSLSDAAVRIFAVLDARVTTKASQQIRQDTLAEQLGWSRSKVQRALADLVTAGHITVRHTARSSRMSVINPARITGGKRTKSSTVPTTVPDPGTASDLTQHTPSSIKSDAADASDLMPLYRNNPYRNTYMTAQPSALTRAGVPIITEPEREQRESTAAREREADDGPEIIPARAIVEYITAIWKVTGHHLDRNHLTDGVLTRIYQHGTSAQETAQAAAEQLAVQGTKVRNPAGYLVKVVLPGIANQTLTAPPASKPTPTPPALAEISNVARCEHGAELGRCALCREEELRIMREEAEIRAAAARDRTCVHGQKRPCDLCDEERRRAFAQIPFLNGSRCIHGNRDDDCERCQKPGNDGRWLREDPQTRDRVTSCNHQERRPDGDCSACNLERLLANSDAYRQAHAAIR